MKQVAQVGAVVTFIWLSGLVVAAEPIDQAFEQLKSYDYGQSHQPLQEIQLYVGRTTTDPERKAQVAERLATVLADPKATGAAKLFVCQQLLLVGTDAQVPPLVKLLDDPKLADTARRTLEAIPGEASLAALRDAMRKLQGPPLIGVINSLGIRRDARSVAAIATHFEASSDPLLVAAAAEALGKIGTAEAAAALSKAKLAGQRLPPYAAALQDAQLRCAELLAAAGDAANAERLCEVVWASDRPVAWRLAGLAGLAKVNKDKAAPLVLEVLGSEDPLVQATAARITLDLPGQAVTAALAQRLEKLDSRGQVLLLDALAERGDRSAADAAWKLTESKDGAVRAAALRAMGKIGDASAVTRLATLAGAGQGAAREALAMLSAPGADERIVAGAARGDPAVRVELLRAIGSRRNAAATALLLKAATDENEGVRRAAFDALAAVGQPESYTRLVELLVASAPADAPFAERAALAVGSRIAVPAERVPPVLAALKAAPVAAKPSLLRVLAACGGQDALQAVRVQLDDADATVRDAAVRALAGWPDASAAEELLRLAKESGDQTHRALALRGYLRLAGGVKDEAARLRILEQVRPIATTTESKKMLLATLSEAADAGALHVATSFLDDQDVQAEAAVAMLKIGRALLKQDRPPVRDAMKAVLEKVKDKAIVDQAQALYDEALKEPVPGMEQKALQRDAKRSDARRADLAKAAPKGYRLACYLDCGPDASDGAKGGPMLRLVSGQAHFWPGAEAAAHERFGSTFYAGDLVSFEASALSPRRTYQVGFCWWDFDHDSREQSVWASTGKGEKQTKLLDKTKLPSGVKNEKPQEKTLPVSQELYADGALRITFRNEGQPNVVVSELWLWESEAEGAQGPAGDPAPPREKGQTARVVIVTGQDSAHDWKATATPLAELLAKDPRLAVRVVEDADFLASEELKDYDVVVMHFQNPKPLAKTQEARANLQKLVENGKGMVVIHFACGAFQEWPEFRNLAGRAYDPKLPPHDPHGIFRVQITDVKHPITAGLQDFDTTDELYTCLAGEAPITLFAEAKSKVTGKMHPMAFVLQFGKGRVFHSPLGHDVKAITNPPVAELYRRGTAWAAGLPPVAEKAPQKQ